MVWAESEMKKSDFDPFSDHGSWVTLKKTQKKLLIPLLLVEELENYLVLDLNWIEVLK
jgi:hypothetical protein